MYNVNIQQIKNGFLVALPPEPITQQQAQKMNSAEAKDASQPIVKYAEDFNGAVALMKANWPVTIEE